MKRGNLHPEQHQIRITSYNVCYTKLLRIRDNRWAPRLHDVEELEDVLTEQYAGGGKQPEASK